MSEPTTEAGRALSAAALHYQSGRWLEPESIAAIETQAAAAARTALLDDLAAAVLELPGEGIAGFFVQRAAVLAEINRRRP